MGKLGGVQWFIGDTTVLPCPYDKEGQYASAVSLPAVPVVVMVSPVAMPRFVISPGDDPGTSIHHRWRGHNHRRSSDDHRRRVHEGRWGGHHDWGRRDDNWSRVDRDPNTYGDPHLCLGQERHGKGGETTSRDNGKDTEKRFGAWHGFYPHC